MPDVRQSVSLKPYNTLALDVRAAYCVEIHTKAMLQDLLQDKAWQKVPKLVLGGGSNVLFAGDFDGLVILNRIQGIKCLKKDHRHVFIKVGAGVNWHALVKTTLEQGWQGLENLSLIPGTVGAAPMQNIGAYGVELCDVFSSLTAMSVDGQQTQTFDKKSCQFGYRTSVFKTKLNNQFIITDVTLRLNKIPKLNTQYAALKNRLAQRSLETPSAKDISNAVIEIRQSKLPDPAKLPNAGSFFKNPIIPCSQYESLLTAHADLPHFPCNKPNHVKIPAAWLIERAGFKGKRQGDVGSHEKQALVLINYGNASGHDLVEFAKSIQMSVDQQFNITLTPEVNMIP